MSETPRSRQDDEYQVLEAIYNDKVIKSASREWLDVSLALGPSHDSKNSEIYAEIVLRVQCSSQYPDEEPVISLSQSRGLSLNQVDNLLIILRNLSVKLKGEVMILELARTVEEFLRENNKPGQKSFYDEMQNRKLLDELERGKKEEDQKTKQRRDIQERVLIKEANAQSSDDDELEPEGRRVRFLSKGLGGVQKYSLSNGETVCDHRCSKYIQFGKKILRGRCMVHENDCVVYYGIDVSNGEPNLIREYSLQLSEKPTQLIVTEKLREAGHLLEKLKNLIHDHLAGYLDFKRVDEKDHIVVYIVQEFVSNISVTAYRSWDVPFIRHLVLAVLKALNYLHENDVIHRNIKASSVFINKEGVVKLTDFALTKFMEEVRLVCRQIPIMQHNYNWATDVSAVADMIADLLGSEPGSLPQLDYVPEQLTDFLNKCYLPEDERWSVDKLLNHSFLKTDIPREHYMRDRRLSCSRQNPDDDEEADDDTDEILSNFKIPHDLKSQSRFLSEFRSLKELGSGSFGVVYKARNRLDGSMYAIKAIKLNPKNKQLNKKMIREVKLLSKLNHENVVRYYNSWIETTIGDDSSLVKQVTSTPLQSLTNAESQREKHSIMPGRKISEGDDEEDYFDDSDEEDDEDDDDSGDESLENQSSPNQVRSEPSESIIFEETRKNISNAADSGNGLELDETVKSETIRQIKNLYIQMQFCAKSTLRIAIDEGSLYRSEKRYWRLVREIVEGLAYIHQQDMIHRDLKPPNIFLDSSDHVKIGDFGLATTSVLNRNNFIIAALNNVADSSESSSHFHTEDSHTGGVGTSFYVAPELQKHNGKMHYNKKVDIYSLGIILFEMAHQPFTTYMERCKTLSNLRLPEVVAPAVIADDHPTLMELLRLLLSHDPAKRPNCTELLAGKYLPAPQVEHSRLQDVINNTLTNSQSKAYKYLVDSCFKQKTSLEEDLTYHADLPASERYYALQETIRDAIVAIFRRHGARNVATPLFLPQGDPSAVADGCVRLMTHSGSVVVAPRDLRVPFARFVARSNVTHMRRYCVSRVFKERRTHGYHPREAFECAFDIITSTPGEYLSDADVLCSLQEIINDLPVLKARNCVLRVNHTMLLQSLLMAFGVEKMYPEVFLLLSQAREGKYCKTKLEACLMNLPLNEVVAGKLAQLFHREDNLAKIKSDVIMLTKRKNGNEMAKKAFELLKDIIDHAEAMGNTIPVRICPGLAHTSRYASGIVFDMICTMKQKRKKDGHEILASGCRYDGLIQKFLKNFEVMGNAPCMSSGVGVSVCLDKLTNAIKDDCEDGYSVTVVVCSLGKDSMVHAKSEMVRNLRAADLISYVLENVETLEDLETYGRENRISHMIWLKDSERDKARIRVWERERERYVEKKICVNEVVDVILRSSRPVCDSDGITPRPSFIDSSVNQNLSIHILVEEKMSTNSRRSREIKIKSKLAPYLANYSSRPTIEVVALMLDLRIIATVVSYLDSSDNGTEFLIDVQQIVDKHPREKKYLIKICDKIQSLYAERENLVVILYSLPEDKWVSRSIK